MSQTKLVRERLESSEKILVGIGKEWNSDGHSEVMDAYEALYQLIRDKDYFIVTTNTDGAIYDSHLDKERITAPCGNVHWRQCGKACTKDIWEEGELSDDVCPHCGAPLTGNTIEAETYIEEGYLPSWKAYTAWLTKTLNRKLTVLELGEGFKTPTVMRWPFEKTVFFNQKSYLYRVNESFFQITEEIRERAEGIQANSVKWVRELSSGLDE